MRGKRQYCDAISPLNDTYATLSRQFGDSVALVLHWEYKDKPRFPSTTMAHKKASLAQFIHCKRGSVR